jgi:hypothetical protein
VTAEQGGDRTFTHHAARERYGLPDAVEGSVNDPRTREDHGVRWNEKWIYFLPGREKRLVFWHRYRCQGVMREAANGSVREEPA